MSKLASRTIRVGGKSIKVVVVVIVALGLLVCCCIGAVLVLGSGSSEARATATPEAEITLEAQTMLTDAPSLTHTPSSPGTATVTSMPEATESTAPSSTPEPTGTPTLTAEPSSTPTASATSTATPEPTSTPTASVTPTSTPTASVTPTRTPEPTAKVDDFESGGLGLSREAWEEIHGQGIKQFVGYSYENDKYAVDYADERIQWLEVRPPGSLSLHDARALTAILSPSDSVRLRTYVPENSPMLTVDVYRSTSLAERFESQWWYDSAPGTYIAIYTLFDDGSSIYIVTGDIP